MADRTVRLTELDGLRGLAALGVALFHLQIILVGQSNPLALVPGSGWLLLKGWHLVDLFFVVSGFIFSHCYLVDGRMRPKVTAGDFAWSRFARLWPLHAAILCFTALLGFRDPGTTLPNFLASLAMMHVFLPDIEVLNPPAWSLSVECICYGIFVLLALKGGRWGLVLGSVAVAALGAMLILTDTATEIGRGLYGFFIGCLVYRCRSTLSSTPWIALLALLALTLVPNGSRHYIIVESALSWPAAILLAAKVPALSSKPIQWLGSRSYAIYLLHVPIYMLLGKILLWVPGIPTAAGMAICLTTVLVLSDILYRRFEMPMQAFLLEWRATRQAQAVPLRS